MTRFSHGFTALAATSLIALAACGDGADTTAIEADPLSAENDALGMPENTDMDAVVADVSEMDDMQTDTAEADVYDVDGTDYEATRVRQGETFVAARAEPLDSDKTARMAALDTADIEREVKDETKRMAAARERLTDPADDGDASFAQLDRNNDGRLSIAEFAIYDLAGVNPMIKGTKQDQKAPFVSTDAINMVTQDFMRIDDDNNMFLSRAEFNAVTM